MSAVISECGAYRYLLTRQLEPTGGKVAFIMLNPSTADATTDDATIRRLCGFAKKWNCCTFTVANLYALRSTDPKQLWSHPDPVGPENDRYLTEFAEGHQHIVCAWGANARAERADVVLEILAKSGSKLWCFGLTKNGMPRHPLYVPSNQRLVWY